MSMRRGNDAVFEIIDKKLIFVCLGVDSTAAHEWGIKSLSQSFGLPELSIENAGVEAHTITTTPKRLAYVNVRGTRKAGPGGKAILAGVGIENDETPTWLFTDYDKLPAQQGWKDEPAPRFTCAWSESQFGIRVTKPYVPYLEQLWEAFCTKDIAIWLSNSNGNPFRRTGGLCIGIVSRFSTENRDAMKTGDLAILAAAKEK